MKKYKHNGKNNRNNNRKNKSLHETRKNHYSELQKQYYMEKNNMNNDFVNNPRFVKINHNLEGEEMMNNTYTGSLVITKSSTGRPLTELEEIELIHQRNMNKMKMEQEIEINNTIPTKISDNEAAATVISVEDIPNETEQVSVINNTIITEEPKSDTPVYSDEEIQKMIDAISSRNNEDTVISNDNILDKEADAAMINPLNRPYTRITMNQSKVIPDNFDIKYIYHTYDVIDSEEDNDEVSNIVKVHVKVTNTNPNDKCLFSSDEFSRIIYNNIEVYPSSAFDGKLIDPKQSIEMIFQYDITELIETLEEDLDNAEENININIYIEINNNENIEIKEIYDEYIDDDDPEDDPYVEYDEEE